MAFPLILGVFYLHGQTLLAIGPVTTYGLATTLSIAVHCNITIRPESVCWALVAYSIKYVRLLATTLGITVRCNKAIRPESVRCALMTHR